MERRRKRAPVAPGVRRFGRKLRRLSGLWILSGVAVAPGCARGPQTAATHAIETVRVVEDARVDFARQATQAERFGLTTTPARPASSRPTTDDTSTNLAWTTPSGWVELAPSNMRAANFRVAGDANAECYLTLLAGDAGGLAANVNRWRAQLSLPPLPASEIDALPRAELLGGQAAFVEAAGSWKGMNGTEVRPSWRLVGLLLVDPNGSAFLKMTGPDDLVAAQRDAFRALARSFHSKLDPASTTPAPSGTSATELSSGAKSEAPSSGASPTEPPSSVIGSVGDATNDGATTHSAAEAAGFAFEVPSGWRRAPDRPSRAFSFFAGPGEDLQCYLTALDGDAGGLLANVNRWRGQLGLTSIESGQLDLMPTVSVLGHDARLVESDGVGASLIGAACMGADRSVFVKMTGPKDLVKAQRGAFLTFCGSLKDVR